MVEKMKCEKCGYEWNYKGNLVYATCPSCLNKTKVNKNIDEKEKE